MKKYIIACMLIILSAGLDSCSLIKKIMGADFDQEQFDKAREAKMLKERFSAAELLKQRIVNFEQVYSSDIVITMSEGLLNKITAQYAGTKGIIDESMDYTINGINVSIKNGSAIATLSMKVRNEKYNVEVNINTDCLLTFKSTKTDLVAQLEPFNIAPQTDAKGLLSVTEDLINSMIRVNLADLSKKIPEIKIPLNLESQTKIEGSNTIIRNPINISIQNPQRMISYNLNLKDLLFLEGSVLVCLNIDKAEVK